jgi:hypothetical protein
MFARAVRFQFPPDDLAHAEDELMRAVREFRKAHAGLERFDVYVNRQTGAALTVSLWREYEQMRAASDDAGDAREDVALETVGWVERVEEYELVDSH